MPGLGGNPYTYNTQGFGSDFTIPGLNNNSIWLTDSSASTATMRPSLR